MPNIIDRWIAVIAVLTAGVSAFFVAVPQADIVVSGLFGGPQGFALADNIWANLLRNVLMWTTRLFALAVLVWLSVTLWRGSQARVNWRLPGFVAAALVAGPWLLVNELFKAHWGRARPYDIVEFGGQALFTPAWQIADQCAANCSFVSGEASMSAATALLIALLIWPDLSRRGRWIWGLILGALGGLGAAWRVVLGAHFTSDALLAVLMSVLIVVALYRMMGIAAVLKPGTTADIRHDIFGR